MRGKEGKKIIDFNDIEHYALEILEHEEAAAEYREKFTCIFVDEYQDSNVLQDTLIERIRRENNLFLVGCQAKHLQIPPGRAGNFSGPLPDLCFRGRRMQHETGFEPQFP